MPILWIGNDKSASRRVAAKGPCNALALDVAQAGSERMVGHWTLPGTPRKSVPAGLVIYEPVV